MGKLRSREDYAGDYRQSLQVLIYFIDRYHMHTRFWMNAMVNVPAVEVKGRRFFVWCFDLPVRTGVDGTVCFNLLR